MIIEAAYYDKLNDDVVECRLCPHHCIVAPKSQGICGVRFNRDGRLFTNLFNVHSLRQIESIERLPILHFEKGMKVLGVGFIGCSMKCPFCTTYKYSQRPATLNPCTANDLVQAAMREKAAGIAYTYSEPTIAFEFLREILVMAHAQQLKNILVTNGMLNVLPLNDLIPFTDAAVVGLKAWESDTYFTELGGRLEHIMVATELLASTCHTEVSYIVMPEKNAQWETIGKLAKRLKEISPDLPLNLIPFVPAHQWSQQSAASMVEMHQARMCARGFLNHVEVCEASAQVFSS